MVQRNGMLGLVRLRMDRVGISKYWTARFASSRGLWEAKRAMPTSAMPYFRLFFAKLQAALRARGIRGQGSGVRDPGARPGTGLRGWRIDIKARGRLGGGAAWEWRGDGRIRGRRS